MADFCTLNTFHMEHSCWVWLRDFRCQTEVSRNWWQAISFSRLQVHFGALMHICPSPARCPSPTPGKPILPSLLFQIFLLAAYPAATHSGIFSYGAASDLYLNTVMEKCVPTDALECPLLILQSKKPNDCVLLGCVTLWDPFGATAV